MPADRILLTRLKIRLQMNSYQDIWITVWEDVLIKTSRKSYLKENSKNNTPKKYLSTSKRSVVVIT